MCDMRPTLHSTMLLLYLTSSLKESSPFRLYIPLCFYYIHSVPWKESPWFLLYIPLCFYYIDCVIFSLTRDYCFTFHYASTISILPFIVLVEFDALHSTMLLLYLPIDTWYSRGALSLHSTMLLLYLLRK